MQKTEKVFPNERIDPEITSRIADDTIRIMYVTERFLFLLCSFGTFVLSSEKRKDK